MSEMQRARPMDRDELALHIVGVSMHLADLPTTVPLAGMSVGLPVTVPGSGWGQVAHLTCGDGEEWWVAVIDGCELPGSPVWVLLTDGEDRSELLHDTNAANLGKYGTPTQLLLGSAMPVLHQLCMHQPVLGGGRAQ